MLFHIYLQKNNDCIKQFEKRHQIYYGPCQKAKKGVLLEKSIPKSPHVTSQDENSPAHLKFSPTPQNNGLSRRNLQRVKYNVKYIFYDHSFRLNPNILDKECTRQ